MLIVKNFIPVAINMFNPSVQDVRNFFFDVYRKGTNQENLTPLEKIAFSVVYEHPEYNNILSDREKYLEFNWSPEAGETNPFLHLSMHVSIHEQLSINQPFGVKELYHDLCEKYQDRHQAEHEVMDCLAEMIWQAQYSNQQPNPEVYLGCLRKKLGKE